VARMRRPKDAIEILLGLADVLADDPGEVNLIEVQPQVPGYDPGRHRLARARGPGEEDFQALAGRDALCKAPLRVDDVPVLDRRGDFLDALQRDAGEDQIIPGMDRLHLGRQMPQALVRLRASRIEEQLRVEAAGWLR